MKGEVSTVDLIFSSSRNTIDDNKESWLDLNALDNDSFSALGLALREDKHKIALKILD
jgi:hypothetical protein